MITGSSGLIGSALSSAMVANGATVYPMVRGKRNDHPFYWEPAQNKLLFEDSIAIDAVVNLAGAGIADQRWNTARKKVIVESRVNSTKILCSTLAKLKHKPKVLVSGSAIGFYGTTNKVAVDESSGPGTDYLSRLAAQWEAATKPASDAGIRTVNIRTGVVLSKNAGALKQMIMPFKLGLGGVIGDGLQYWSWISLDDVVKIIQFVINNESIHGPINLVSPQPVTNHRFTKTLGRALKRPTFLPMPAFIARLLFGEMANALLLSSIQVLPKKLQKAGYHFVHRDLDNALNTLLSRTG